MGHDGLQKVLWKHRLSVAADYPHGEHLFGLPREQSVCVISLLPLGSEVKWLTGQEMHF